MAGNLLPGDWLLINKAAYGTRLPITPLTLPFTPYRSSHSSPKYYLKWISLPYYRLPGYSYIKRNDIIAFNYPEEEDVPVDKRIVYLKRCVAIPGDTLKIVNSNLIVNRKKIKIENVRFEYLVKVKSNKLSQSVINKYQLNEGVEISNYGEYDLFLSVEQADKLKKENEIAGVERELKTSHYDFGYVYPHDPGLGWTLDNYGFVVIPKAGEKIILNKRNLSIYRDMLEKYENCTISVSHDSVYINNIPVKNYFFKNNYYFVLDDNRDNAKDSRLWGFLPESHIIGKVSIILISFNPSASGISKIRWNRTLTIHF